MNSRSTSTHKLITKSHNFIKLAFKWSSSLSKKTKRPSSGQGWPNKRKNLNTFRSTGTNGWMKTKRKS